PSLVQCWGPQSPVIRQCNRTLPRLFPMSSGDTGTMPAREMAAIAAADPIIRVRGLTKVYRVGEVDVHALRGVDLDVTSGEFVAIVGASGSGKSTLFHILGGLTPPTSGKVLINGKHLTAMSNKERTELRK